MRVLVTGGAGFIGSHVMDRFVELGHEPAALDDFSGGKRDNLPDGVPVFEADIRERDSLTTAYDDFHPDAVCHLAAQVSVSRSVREPEFDAQTNVLGLLNVVQEAARVGAKRVVFSSTGGALYGDVSEPADEDHPCLPISPYGISKLTGERYLEFCANNAGLTTVALRFSNVYGPRQDPHGEAGVVAIFCQKMLAGEQVTIHGDGKFIRDYVEVRDVAAAVAAATLVDSDAPFTAFNVGTGIGADVNQLASILLPACAELRSARGLPAEIPQPHHGPDRPGDLRSSLVSPRRIGEALNWEPKMSLEEGLRQTAEWFAERVLDGGN